MRDQTRNIVIGVTVGIAVGIVIALCVFVAVVLYRKRRNVGRSLSDLTASTLPMRANDASANLDTSPSFSYLDDDEGDAAQRAGKRIGYFGQRTFKEKDLLTLSGIPRYIYKDIHKATDNFTSLIGHGSFGPVYKAKIPTGGVVAVKVLANDSKQGDKEFKTEVLLLGRLHHRNLVNLVGYCVDKGQRMLIYEYMSNGNLASHLYKEGPRSLSWEERLQIALDVSHGIEYLHEGASPSVIHRDLKSANILLDRSMRAKVADFGLSKEDVYDGRMSGLKGTYGYMDPEYMSTNKFTKKSDIYSFGIILFELITAINPQQGLTEYINLAAIGGGLANWDEILDKKLVGSCNPQEVSLLADTAYQCLHRVPRKRPSIADVTVAISKIRQQGSAQVGAPGSFGGCDGNSSFLEMIELQHAELNTMVGHKELQIPVS